ncbi:family 43 glycosylhydrolase [Parasediminibacterium sp. JCM 36343]|uniref:family 43 glycosylhydrolase n=1 Tax=Parasediminibacterium sp. JCM 36343 TaxID=3374279 RepID=UPI00397B62D9
MLRVILLVICIATALQSKAQALKKPDTYCNPMDISYRFRPDTPSRREAADPTIVLFKNKYFLFASKSGGYWASDDLKSWQFLTNNTLPWEAYAPTAVVIGDELYFLASGSTIYKTSDPVLGNWVKCGQIPIHVIDPCLFLDDDKRLYLYYGSSSKEPLKAVEIDYNNGFSFIGTPIPTIYSNAKEHGFEHGGNENTGNGNPYMEGSWINKHDGKYYLQYAAPGTQYKSYADGVYESTNPLGPFTYATHNPFSYKPSGFIAGAGHSNTFQDKYGNYWHVSTMVISVKHIFERRLGLFPAGFDKDGIMQVFTGFGDYPFLIPDKKIDNVEALFKGWMLLSYNKPVTVSSTLDTVKYKPIFSVDEDIKTYWSASTGNKGEWLMVDLQGKPTINAMQINFAEQDTKTLGRPEVQAGYQYVVEYSNDKQNWHTVIDQSTINEDRTHPYFQLQKPIKAAYIRVMNIATPDGKFAISGLRVFGKANAPLPKAFTDFTIIRQPEDKHRVKLSWEKVDGATGYNVRYGIASDKLYSNYIVNGKTALDIRSLNTNNSYWFTVDVFNEAGVSKPGKVVKVE